MSGGAAAALIPEPPPFSYSVNHAEEGDFSFQVVEPPLPSAIIDELMALWAHPDVFGHAPDDGEDGTRAQLLGAEVAYNRHVLYVARVVRRMRSLLIPTVRCTERHCYPTANHPLADSRDLSPQGEELAASVKLTVARRPRALGTLGEVATHPSFRRRGIAQVLCKRAQDDFMSLGGQMIALGTGNPVAARRYFAIGYRQLPGTAVWYNNVADARSPEEWAVDYFRTAEAAALAAGGGDLTSALTIAQGNPMARVRMCPLMHYPHENLLSLDANIGLYSTRASIMTSVNGLYPRYANLLVENRGRWWTAETCPEEHLDGDGHEHVGTIVGLATACFHAADQGGVVWVDGFLHGKWSDGWTKLMQHGPLHWATKDGRFTRACARVPKADTSKLALYQSLGFVMIAVQGVPFHFMYSYPVEGDDARDGETREHDSVVLQLDLTRAAH